MERAKWVLAVIGWGLLIVCGGYAALQIIASGRWH